MDIFNIFRKEKKPENPRDFLSRICLHINWVIYKIFVIWYYKDGWFFISDVWKKWLQYIAIKHSMKSVKEAYSIKLKKPKLSHHIDWSAHISWVWIRSWYNETWKPKWLWVESFDLNWINDGGPVFSFILSSKSLNIFPIIPFQNENDLEKISNKPHLIIPEWWMINSELNSNVLNYLIEWYYIHKSCLSKKFIRRYNKSWWKLPWIKKSHPIHWEIKLIPLATPNISPYIFWFTCTKVDTERWDENFTFSFWWAPWKIQEDGSWDVINIMLDNESNLSWWKSLNYNKKTSE